MANKSGKYIELDLQEILTLDDLIAGSFGRSVSKSGLVVNVYEAPAIAYTPRELCELVGVDEENLDSWLLENWQEHDILAILDEKEIVRFTGEGVLLSPDFGETIEPGPALCRLFTPTPNWKPGSREECLDLEVSGSA